MGDGCRRAGSERGSETGHCSWIDQIEWGLIMSYPPNILGDQPRARVEHSIGPARNVGRHQHVRQIMEGSAGWRRRDVLAGIAIPDIERCACNRPLGES